MFSAMPILCHSRCGEVTTLFSAFFGVHDWARTQQGRLKEAETPTQTISRCYHERWRLKAHCHCHPRMKRYGASPPGSDLSFVGCLLPALVQWQRQHRTARTEESGCKQKTPPRSFPVAQPGPPSFLPLSSSFCNHSWFPFFGAIGLQEGDLFSSNIIKLAALVLVVASAPEQLQPVPSLSKLEEGIVFPNFLQKASLVHVGFCKGYFHGLKLPLQLWHFL